MNREGFIIVLVGLSLLVGVDWLVIRPDRQPVCVTWGKPR